MSVMRVLAGPPLRADVVAALAPALRAAMAGLGPEGRRALYSTGGRVRIAQTGTEVIRHFTGGSAAETVLREAFVSAEQDLGDGAARLAAMVQAALQAGHRAITAGIHPTALGRAASAFAPDLDREFAALTRPLDDLAPLLAATGLPAAAQAALARAVAAAGPEGEIELIDSTAPGFVCTPMRGFSAGIEPLLGPLPERMERVFVLVANDVITDFARLVPVIEGFAKTDKSLVIAARGLEGPARALLARNAAADVLRIAAITPAEKGPHAAEILRDLAAATGAALVGEDSGLGLDRLTPAGLGRAATLRIAEGRITLAEPAGDPADVALRLREIEAEIARARHLALDRERAQRRHARLRGAWAELSIGPDRTRPELMSGMVRAKTALRVARAGGTIPGAGLGLSAVAAALAAAGGRDDTATRAARHLTCEALRAPERQLRRNAGAELHAADWATALPPLADPAPLSRRLAGIAVSLALHLLAFEVAVLRDDATPDRG